MPADSVLVTLWREHRGDFVPIEFLRLRVRGETKARLREVIGELFERCLRPVRAGRELTVQFRFGHQADDHRDQLALFPIRQATPEKFRVHRLSGKEHEQASRSRGLHRLLDD